MIGNEEAALEVMTRERPTRSTKPCEPHSTASEANSTARPRRVYRYRPAGIRWPWRPEKRRRRRG